MGSFCDSCEKPGHCCTRIIFNRGDGVINNPLSDEKTIIDYMEFNIGENPFYLIGWDGENYRWGCVNLNPVTGRCNDYENRPQLCRDYEPKSCSLCYHYEEILE